MLPTTDALPVPPVHQVIVQIRIHRFVHPNFKIFILLTRHGPRGLARWLDRVLHRARSCGICGAENIRVATVKSAGSMLLSPRRVEDALKGAAAANVAFADATRSARPAVWRLFDCTAMSSGGCHRPGHASRARAVRFQEINVEGDRRQPEMHLSDVPGGDYHVVAISEGPSRPVFYQRGSSRKGASGPRTPGPTDWETGPTD